MCPDTNSEEPFYFGEVIGSALSYHQPTCHIVRQIHWRNYKRLRDWREAVSLGLNPCPHCRPPFIVQHTQLKKEITKPTEFTPLTAARLADLRRGLLRILDMVEQASRGSDGIAQRIERLSRGGVVPREVAVCMHMIRELRNVAEYDAKTISQSQAVAVAGALGVIREWIQERGLTLPDELKDEHEVPK